MPPDTTHNTPTATQDSRKRALDRSTLLRLLACGGIAPTRVGACLPLPGGTCNTLYRAVLTDGPALLLKIPPPPGTPAMTYERGLLRGETEFYRQAARHTTVPVPEVVYADLDGEVLPGGFLLMTELPGAPWHEAPPADAPSARRALGRLAAELHAVPGPRFGYPAEPFPGADDWPAAFTTALGAALDDARRYGAALPVPPDDIAALAQAAAPALAAVTAPALVHYDLWQGNILLTGDTITGVIDGERMFWGDPLADFASLNLLRGPEDDPDLLAGYREAAGLPAASFDDAARVRLALYRAYLYLIMLTENHPRASSPEQHAWTRTHAGPALVSALDTIEELTGTKARQRERPGRGSHDQ